MAISKIPFPGTYMMKGEICVKEILKNRQKWLFYSVPTALALFIIFLMILGLWGIWEALFLYVLPLFIGSYLLEQGKPFGCLIGFFFGIHMIVGDLLEVPRRINMGNAGPRIEATPEIYWRSFWGNGNYWFAIFSLFFLALGIYVFVKNRKNSRAES